MHVKKQGGLGIGSLMLKNRALSFKRIFFQALVYGNLLLLTCTNQLLRMRSQLSVSISLKFIGILHPLFR